MKNEISVLLLTEEKGFERIDSESQVYKDVMNMIPDKEGIFNIVILKNPDGALSLMKNVTPTSMKIIH